MKLRTCCILFVALAMVACGGAVEEPADTAPAETAAEAPAEAPMDAAAALDEMTDYFVTHYNMHHPDMVAELYAEDAVFLAADGSVQEGREAILAAMEEGMAAEPTLSLDVADRVISGDWAVSRGTWAMEMTPEGAPGPMSVDGHFMTASQQIEGEWKISGVVSNYDETPPAELPRGEAPGEAPPDVTDTPLSEVIDYYATHYNMGHGDMVASRFTEDAVAAFANLPLAEGRAAVAERLNTRIAEGDSPQITVHQVAAMDIGDGWVVGGGWYEMSSSTGDMDGSWMLLARPGDDGNMQIHWLVSNGQPAMQ